MRRRRGLREFGLIGLTIFLAFTLFPLSSVNADTSIWYYPPYPQGEVGIATPEIGWRIFIDDNELEDAQFIVNGIKYTTEYNLDRNGIFLNLDKPLTGVINVTARIKLKRYNWIEKSWSFTISKSSLTTLPQANLAQLKAIDYANDYRYIMKLPLFESNSALNMSAQVHANYQNTVGKLTHYQSSANPAFIGESVKDRAAYYGFNGMVAEDISYNTKPSIQKSVDDLFDAPYHRIPFLNPALDRLGYGEKQYYSVLDFGGVIQPKESTFVAYPGDGQIQVPIEWENYETPDPLRLYPNAPKKVGYPIMVGIYGEDTESIQLIDAKLINSDGQQVQVYINSPQTDDQLSQEVIIIPQSPLKTNSKYRVQVSLQEINRDGESTSYQKSWSFTTESKIGEGKNWLHDQVVYPSFREDANFLKLFLGQRYIWLDQAPFPLDIAPFIKNSRTMVPFRAIGTIFGAQVDWDSINRVVTYEKNDIRIEIPIGTNFVYINGHKVAIDQGAVIENGRSFVPVRFISEQLGAVVKWDSSVQAVTIQLP